MAPSSQGLEPPRNPGRFSLEYLEFKEGLCCVERSLAHGDGADWRRTLDAGGRVHHITGHDALTLLGPRSQRHNCFAGLDADPNFEV